MAPDGSLSLRRRNTQVDSVPEIEKRSQSPQTHTIAWHELQEWQKDNEYILNGYRRVQNRWTGCLKSVYAYLHNETVNIHTHLWGAVLFLYFCATFHGSYIKPFALVATWHDSAVILIFLLSALFCLAASALFHTSVCHSDKVASRCHAYDYTGIVCLIVGSNYPAIRYGFFCNARSQITYLTAASLMGLGVAYIVLNPEYSKPTHRGARTIVFVGLGLSGVVPVAHLAATHGIHELLTNLGMGWLLTSGMLYMAGALL